MIDGHKLIMSLNDWWYSSFGYEETAESKAIKKVIDEVEKYVEQDRADGKRGRVMSDLTREQCFCQWVISKILALYMTQEDFRNEVDIKVNDGYSFSIGGEKMSEYEQAEWKLNMVCVDIAKQFTEYYFKDFWGDEFDADRKTEQTERSE